MYTCHIRKGCKFASGNELTAKDFKYRVARINALSEWDVIIGGCTKGEDCVKILDDYTFESPRRAQRHLRPLDGRDDHDGRRLRRGEEKAYG